jgi:hypothetical protein
MTEQKSWRLARYEEQKKLHRPRIPYGYLPPLNPRALDLTPRWQDGRTLESRRLAAEREQRGIAPDPMMRPVIFTAAGGIEGYANMSFEQRLRHQRRHAGHTAGRPGVIGFDYPRADRGVR